MASFAPAYARALADVVLDASMDTAGIDSQLQDFASTLGDSQELREVLYSPSIKLDRRLAILDALNEKMHLNREVRNFIAVLMRNSRLHAFNEVLAAYRREINLRSGIADATVTSARKLDDAERQAVEQQAASLAGRQIRAIFQEDSALVGGMILRIGSTVYDGSVRGRLERLQEQLIAG